jgi:DNA-binding transcriptional regulator YdaS (Cro superfamily)
MGDVVNLRGVRKRTAKQLREKQAAENRFIHGRSKAERATEEARKEKLARDLDWHRLESGEANEVTGREAVHRDRRPQDERES